METTKTKTVYITRNELFKEIDMVLCNNISKADESFIDDNMHLYQRECTECEGTGEIMTPMGTERCEECNGDGQHNLEVYQEFICDPSDWKIAQLKEYGVNLGYSELLDVHVLPIYDFGTGWSAFSYSKEVPENYELDHNETLTRQTVY